MMKPRSLPLAAADARKAGKYVDFRICDGVILAAVFTIIETL